MIGQLRGFFVGDVEVARVEEVAERVGRLARVCMARLLALLVELPVELPISVN